MRTRLTLMGLVLASLLAAVFDHASRLSIDKTSATLTASKPTVVANYERLPLAFEVNNGQTNTEVKFLSRGNGYTLFLAGDEAVLALLGKGAGASVTSPDEHLKRPVVPHSRLSISQSQATGALRMKLVGANQDVRAEGLDELPGRSNYFIGSDPQKWRTNVPNYARVKYEQVYPGIDLVYYGNQRQLEYDFLVAPNADPRAIRFQIEEPNGKPHSPVGQKSALKIDENGDLVIAMAGGQVRFHKPVVYQTSSGTEGVDTSGLNREMIPGEYTLTAESQVSFSVGAYDHTRPLIIDPVLSYATYLGGVATDFAVGIAVDSVGNAYVTGSTGSPNFPSTSGAYAYAYDAFLTKISADGASMVYSTFIGGALNSDMGVAVAVDKTSGSAFVGGYTDSPDFPTTANAFQKGAPGDYSWNAFVTKVSPTGDALQYSTLLGGNQQEYLNALAIDSSGAAYVTGTTNSTNFPTKNPLQAAFSGGDSCNGDPCEDAFITKISADGSTLVYSTYLGKTGDDVGAAIAVDSSGNAFVGGWTNSSDFPTHNPLQATLAGGYDAFVLKLNPAGSALLFSTFLGGGGDDLLEALTIDTDGNIYVVGATTSSNFPMANAYQSSYAGNADAFVSKLSSTGGSLVFSTFLGGSGLDTALGIALDSSRNIYLMGETTSTNFPTVSPLQANSGGGADAFVTEFPAAGGTPLFSTYLGGSGDEATISGAIAVDSVGEIFVTGDTTSGDFPTVKAIQPLFGGGVRDGFVAKIIPATGSGLSLSATSLNFGTQLTGATSGAMTSKVTNIGSQAVTISSITLSEGTNFAQTNNCPLSPVTLSGGGSCTISVTFKPQSIGALKDDVVISSDAPGSPQMIDLEGTGIWPTAAPSTNAVDFGNERKGTASAARTVTLTNNGGATLHLASSNAVVISGPNSGDFAIATGTTCTNGLSVASSGGSCVVNVTFTPSTTAAEGATLTFTDDAQGVPGTMQQVSLAGTGVFPQATPSTTLLNFPNQQTNQPSAPLTLTLTNGGTDSLHLAATSAVTITGTNAADFGLVAGTTTCTNGATVAAGGSCIINVTFDPPVVGNRSATLTITDDASPTTQVVTLSGTGVTAVVSLSSPQLDFGNQRTGTPSESMSLTLTNNGNSSVQLAAMNAVVLGGVNSTDFTLATGTTCMNGLIVTAAPGPGNSCVINITFTPGANGARSATVTVSDNANPATQSANLKGTGVFPQAAPTPTTLNFGSQVINTPSAALRVTLTNSGTDTLHLDPAAAVAINGTNGTDFSIGTGTTCANGSTVAANGGTCIVNLTFTPSALNGRTANLTITDDASPTTQSVTLNGTGANPAPVITSLSQTSATAGGPGFTLTVNGSNFVSGAVVNFNGTAETTVYVSGTQLTATIKAGDIAIGGSFNVTVTNPAPGGGTSAAQTFTVNNPMPSISSLSPANMPAGQGFTLTIGGTNFMPNSTVAFNGKNEPTTYVSATQLSVAIPASDTSTGGPMPLTVTNTAPGGGTSAAMNEMLDDFSPSTSSSSAVISPGQSATITITVTPSANGFAEPVTFSVSGLPPHATASFNPQTLTPGSQVSSTTLTIETTQHGGLPVGPKFELKAPAIQFGALCTLTVLLTLILSSGQRLRVNTRRLAASLPLLLALLGLMFVGSACHTSGLLGTRQGSYTLTIAARSGTDVKTINVVLTVKQ